MYMYRHVKWLVILSLLLLLLSCADTTQEIFTLSGVVTDGQGLGLEGVSILFLHKGGEEIGLVKTNDQGEWIRSQLFDEITVIPALEGYIFHPEERVVKESRDDVDFIGHHQQITIIGSQGGIALSGDGYLELLIEPYSLEEETSISIHESFVEAPYSFGSLYTFGPEGTTFHPPALLTISFKDLELPTDLKEEEEDLFIEGLRLGHYTDEGWEHLPTTLDREEKTLSTEVSHFSHLGIYPDQHYLVIVDIIGVGTVEPGEGLFYYAPNELLKLSAIPEEDWVFKGFTIYLPGELLPIHITDPDPDPIILDHGEGEDSSILQISVTATFEFEPLTPQVELHVSMEGEGSVTPPVGTHLYDSGTTVHLLAYSDTGWWFERWVLHTARGLEDDYIFTESSISYELHEDMWAKATFIEAPITYELTIEKEGEGTVEPKEGTREYPKDWEVPLRATPDLGWYLDQWLITDSWGNSYSIYHEEEIDLPITEDLTARAIFKDSDSYTIYGFVSLDDGTPLERVTISFSGGYESVKTDEKGFWERDDLAGTVLVKASKENISFTPNQIEVREETAHVNFVGLKDYDLIFYDTVKMMGREAKENIQSITEDSLIFKEITPFVDSLQVGDILIGQYHEGAHLSLQTHLPEEGLLVKITDISDGGRRLSLEEAYLEETIQWGTLTIEEIFPYEEMFVDIDSHPHILFFDPIEKTLEFRKEMASDVWIEGHLKFELDFGLDGTISFAEGVEDCQFSISPFMEVEVKLKAEKEATLAREISIHTWDPTHIRVPIFPGAYFQPRIDFLVGARGNMEAEMETGVTYSRGITAGIMYSKESGWERVSHMPDGDWQVNEPTFAAKAEGEAYAGVKFSGIVNHLVGLYAGPYLYLDAAAEIDTAALIWEYRMGIGLKLVTGASLEILRIASLSYDLPSINLYHKDIAYGISGQVVDWDIFGLEEAKVTFTGEKGPFAPVYPVGDLGFWYKHRLEGDVMVRPELEGYTFVEEEIEVQGAMSKVNFFGSYEVQGFVRDKEGEGIEGVELTFHRFPEMKATTTADGSWKQKDLYGAVSITPFKEGYTFEPVDHLVKTHEKKVNFTGTYEVSGWVRDKDGEGIGEALISFDYPGIDGVLTSPSGYWKQDGLSGTVMIKASKVDYILEPESILVTGPRDNVNFFEAYEISGYIRDEDGVGIGGILISFSKDIESVTTFSDGSWRRDGLSGEVRVTPQGDGYEFLPEYIEIYKARDDVDFTAFYTIKGFVLDKEEKGIANAFISFNGKEKVTTDEKGFWQKTGLSGEVTVAIYKYQYRFEPTKLVVTKPGETIFIRGEYDGSPVPFDMVLVPAGSLPDEMEWDKVATVANDFWIGVTEVTYELWYDVRMWSITHGFYIGFYETGREGSRGVNGAEPTIYKDQPVTNISWMTAAAWCNVLTLYHNFHYDTEYETVYDLEGGWQNVIIKDTDGFRLPYGNEWQRAASYPDNPGNYASGGTAPAYPEGESRDGYMHWYYDRLESNQSVAWYRTDAYYLYDIPLQTAPVALKKPNALGLYDMSGNVRELCNDINPDPAYYWYRMTRGGTYYSSPEYIQLYKKTYFNIHGTDSSMGLRVVRSD